MSDGTTFLVRQAHLLMFFGSTLLLTIGMGPAPGADADPRPGYGSEAEI